MEVDKAGDKIELEIEEEIIRYDDGGVDAHRNANFLAVEAVADADVCVQNKEFK